MAPMPDFPRDKCHALARSIISRLQRLERSAFWHILRVRDAVRAELEDDCSCIAPAVYEREPDADVTEFARWLGAWLKRAEERGRLPFDLSDEACYISFNESIAASRGLLGDADAANSGEDDNDSPPDHSVCWDDP